MTEEQVERVARAILVTFEGVSPWAIDCLKERDAPYWLRAIPAAQAAIEAMQEPTEDSEK